MPTQLSQMLKLRAFSYYATNASMQKIQMLLMEKQINGKQINGLMEKIDIPSEEE